MNPTKSQLEALGRVKRGEPTFVEWLQARYSEYSSTVAGISDDVHLRWHQGKMQELNEIIGILSKAEKL